MIAESSAHLETTGESKVIFFALLQSSRGFCIRSVCGILLCVRIIISVIKNSWAIASSISHIFMTVLWLLCPSALPMKLRLRDAHIGWSASQRKTHLHRIVNNIRFLIPPWIDVPNLASHVLAKTLARLSRDWEE